MKVRCIYADECGDERCHHFYVHEWDQLRGCKKTICKRVQATDARCEIVEEDEMTPKIRKQAKIIGQPTPPEVKDAIKTIAAYLREGGWCEAIISDSGGAAFHLTSIFELIPGTEGIRQWVEEDKDDHGR